MKRERLITDPAEALYFSEVGARIRIAGLALGMTAAEQSRDMGIDQSRLGHWVAGRHRLNIFILSSWCLRRGVTADYLFLNRRDGLPNRLHAAIERAEKEDQQPKSKPRPGRRRRQTDPEKPHQTAGETTNASHPAAAPRTRKSLTKQ